MALLIDEGFYEGEENAFPFASCNTSQMFEQLIPAKSTLWVHSHSAIHLAMKDDLKTSANDYFAC